MEYDYFQKEKLEYEDIEIPDELLMMVRRIVAADRRKKAVKRRDHFLRIAGSLAAAAILCLTVGVNSSYAFAKTAVKIPVVKSVAKALIVRSYKTEVITVAEEELKIERQEKEGQKAPIGGEALSDVSGNMIGGANTESQTQAAESAETEAGGETEETLQGLEAWKFDLTLKELKSVTEVYTAAMEEGYADTPEKLRTILLAELPEEEIYLYGYHENGAVKGVALRVKDKFVCYDWNYMDDTAKLPELFCVEKNGDETEEIGVLLYHETLQKAESPKEAIAEPKTDKAQESGEEAQTAEKPAEEKTDSANSTGTKSKSAEAAAQADAKSPESDTGSAKTQESANASSESEAGNGKTQTAANTADNIKSETTSADDAAQESAESAESQIAGEGKQTVSENDVKLSEPSQKERGEEAPRQAGELWIVTLVQENWTADVLTADDFENELLQKIKAEYDAGKQTLQLYRAKEAFGEPVLIEAGEEGLIWKELRIAPESRFQYGKNLSFQFTLQAVFESGENENTVITLPFTYEAEILYENHSFETGTIEFG